MKGTLGRSPNPWAKWSRDERAAFLDIGDKLSGNLVIIKPIPLIVEADSKQSPPFVVSDNIVD